MSTPADFFKDSTVLITGATCAVGREVARAFTMAGARLVFTGADAKYGVQIAKDINAMPAFGPKVQLSAKPRANTQNPRIEMGETTTKQTTAQDPIDVGASAGELTKACKLATDVGIENSNTPKAKRRNNMSQRAQYIHWDGTSEEGIKRAMRSVGKNAGGLDIAINIISEEAGLTFTTAATSLQCSLDHASTAMLQSKRRNPANAAGTIINAFATGGDDSLLGAVEPLIDQITGKGIHVSPFNLDKACGKNAPATEIAQALVWLAFEEQQAENGDQPLNPRAHRAA